MTLTDENANLILARAHEAVRQAREFRQRLNRETPAFDQRKSEWMERRVIAEHSAALARDGHHEPR